MQPFWMVGWSKLSKPPTAPHIPPRPLPSGIQGCNENIVMIYYCKYFDITNQFRLLILSAWGELRESSNKINCNYHSLDHHPPHSFLIIISEPPWYIAPLFAANVFCKVGTFYRRFYCLNCQGRTPYPYIEWQQQEFEVSNHWSNGCDLGIRVRLTVVGTFNEVPESWWTFQMWIFLLCFTCTTSHGKNSELS